jgi:hypothetical protein
MNSPAQSRITRRITCIQPTNSGELEKAEDDRKAEAAEAAQDVTRLPITLP